MKVLTVIASYGTNNDAHLRELVASYAAMPYQVDVVVLSNISKPVPSGVELVVGLPMKNPWSLPFAHRPIFDARRDDYDVFIYSEDDTLITARHIEAFLDATKVLHADEIAGFVRSEQAADGTLYYSTVHRHYHWDVRSVCRRGGDVFAHFTNEHGACYMLTRSQLHRAIASGGFIVAPHEGKYDMLVSAATDPYTQCGFRKLVAISRLDDFTCRHLSNKYIGRTGLEKSLFDIQVRALLERAGDDKPADRGVRVETRLTGTRWAKSYYEPLRRDLIAMIPATAGRVLSVGCGWGQTEGTLESMGLSVTAIPLDAVIGEVARSRGVRVVATPLDDAPRALCDERFDVLLISNLLHLVARPQQLLRAYGGLVAPSGIVIVSCPNVGHVAVQLRRLARQRDLRDLANFERSGIHPTSARRVVRWLETSGFAVQRIEHTVEGRWARCDRLTLGRARRWLASEFAIAARKLPPPTASVDSPAFPKRVGKRLSGDPSYGNVELLGRSAGSWPE